MFIELLTLVYLLGEIINLKLKLLNFFFKNTDKLFKNITSNIPL